MQISINNKSGFVNNLSFLFPILALILRGFHILRNFRRLGEFRKKTIFIETRVKQINFIKDN